MNSDVRKKLLEIRDLVISGAICMILAIGFISLLTWMVGLKWNLKEAIGFPLSLGGVILLILGLCYFFGALFTHYEYIDNDTGSVVRKTSDRQVQAVEGIAWIIVGSVLLTILVKFVM